MIEATLVTALSAIVARVYPDIAETGTALPYVTYQQVGGTPVNYLAGVGSDKKNARIQINVWATTRIEAMTLIRQVEDAMVASPLYGLIEGGAQARYDEETKTRGATQDFSFWS